MKIRRDPARAAKADIADILRNHEWLFKIEVQGAQLPDGLYFIDYEMLADLVYDISQGKTFGRGAIN